MVNEFHAKTTDSNGFRILGCNLISHDMFHKKTMLNHHGGVDYIL